MFGKTVLKSDLVQTQLFKLRIKMLLAVLIA